jgi:hypothetical protein
VFMLDFDVECCHRSSYSEISDHMLLAFLVSMNESYAGTRHTSVLCFEQEVWPSSFFSGTKTAMQPVLGYVFEWVMLEITYLEDCYILFLSFQIFINTLAKFSRNCHIGCDIIVS